MPIKTAQVRFAKEKLLVLERYVGSSDDPKFFVHFSFFNKVGINPRSGFDTPNGFYGYPLTNEIFKQLISGKLPFAQERPYIHVFSYGGELLNLKHYGNGQFQSDMRKLISNNKVTEDEAKRFASEARNPSPSGKFWNITRMIANGPNRWNALFQWLGYGGVVDLGLGIIHPQEPEQMVIFDTPGIIQVKTMINPYVSRLTPDYTNHNLDKQDYEDASRKKRLNTYDDSDYETDIPPRLSPQKSKSVFGCKLQFI